MDLCISLRAEEGPLPSIRGRDFPSTFQHSKAQYVAFNLEVNVIYVCGYYFVTFFLVIVLYFINVIYTTGDVGNDLNVGTHGFKIKANNQHAE